MDQETLDMLAECESASQAAYETSGEFNNWRPPPGKYPVLVKGTRFRVNQGKGDNSAKSYGALNVAFEIQDGPEASKVFEKGFLAQVYSHNSELKQLLSLVQGSSWEGSYSETISNLMEGLPGQAFNITWALDKKNDKYNTITFDEVL